MSKPTPIPASREKVLVLIDADAGAMRCAVIGSSKTLSADQKLAELTSALAFIAVAPETTATKAALIKLYGFTVGWLMSLKLADPRRRIHLERNRQERLFKKGDHLFTCASPVADPLRKLRVLVEEVGEVAQCIDMIEFFSTPYQGAFSKGWRRHLINELVQVAAVCVAWLESLEVQS